MRSPAVCRVATPPRAAHPPPPTPPRPRTSRSPSSARSARSSPAARPGRGSSPTPAAAARSRRASSTTTTSVRDLATCRRRSARRPTRRPTRRSISRSRRSRSRRSRSRPASGAVQQPQPRSAPQPPRCPASERKRRAGLAASAPTWRRRQAVRGSSLRAYYPYYPAARLPPRTMRTTVRPTGWAARMPAWAETARAALVAWRAWADTARARWRCMRRGCVAAAPSCRLATSAHPRAPPRTRAPPQSRLPPRP